MTFSIKTTLSFKAFKKLKYAATFSITGKMTYSINDTHHNNILSFKLFNRLKGASTFSLKTLSITEKN